MTTLRYLTIDDMIRAIGLPKEKLCLYCWTGEYPAEAATQKKNSRKGRKRQKNKNKYHLTKWGSLLQ
jgi:glutamine phosphoribosylpyrophosphate amidotransferase